ncbi:MAG: alpha/beta hydrolase [Intrasporangium sp.]|uniref:alpha/beta fold hydrolase n=1 Tax=Intrasporangium sp. TaxID=1925024 RepID=UPI0026476FE8|nr:alpha/beta hydrolase [Intrasporangium sp.]MDN5795827.1 alpha/beta hydrolase [Intrasporangium sp.]
MTQPFARSADRFIESKGLRLRVRDYGAGRPLLLVNGLGGYIEGWQALADELPGRRLIAVDHPGTGRSQVPDCLMTIPALSGLYLEVIDRLGVEAFDVMGYSFGGLIAQQLAKDHPDRVRSMVLAATVCGWGGFPADPLAALILANPLLYRSTVVHELCAPLLYRGRVGRNPRLLRSELRGWNGPRGSMLGLLFQLTAGATWSSLPWLCRLTMPTLVLGGEEDPLAPMANARLLAARIPNAELRVVDRGGHLFPIDRAKDVGPLITEFLDRHLEAATA